MEGSTSPTANAGRNTVSVLLNQGGSPPSFLRAPEVPVGLGPFDIVSADFNRDGIPDLAVTNADAHTISILLGTGAGGFSRTDIAARAPRGPRGIIAAHVTEDDRIDLDRHRLGQQHRSGDVRERRRRVLDWSGRLGRRPAAGCCHR